VALVAEEVARLPEKYRLPVVLCCLEGKSYSEAGVLLGWPEGTVAGRLSRAREMLRKRLVRRGLGPVEASQTALLMSAMPPMALMQATLRAALRFAAGEQLTAPAAALAEEVLRTMVLTKLSSGAALLLALAFLGTGLTLLVRAAPPVPPTLPRTVMHGKKPDSGQPAEWAGRWLANPFAGAVLIEVQHRRRGGGPPQAYLIKDPATVAEVVRAARITSIRNGMHMGRIPTAQVTLRDGQGSSLDLGLGSDDSVVTKYGTISMTEGFFTALGQAAVGQGKPAINFREFLPGLGPAMPVKPAPRLSAKSLATGFDSLELTYDVADRLHSTRIADAKTLAIIHKALTVLGMAPVGDARAQSRHMSGVCKDGASFYFQIQDRKSVVDLGVGKFTLAPAFFDAVNREVSARAGFPIEVTGPNRLPEQSLARARQFRELLDKVKSLRCKLKRGATTQTILVEGEEARQMVKNLAWIEGQPGKLKLPREGTSVELTTKDGRTIDLWYLNHGPAGIDGSDACAMPGLGQLVEVSGLGQLWIDNQWLMRFGELAYKREMEAKQKRDVETGRMVCRDWPAFLKVVVSVSAWYSVDDSELSEGLQPEQTRAVVALLRTGRYEQLNWSEKRWLKELRSPGYQKGGSLELAPGLGFSLPLAIVSDKELLVPMCGRIRFADSPIAKLQKIIDPDNPGKVKLLPPGKARE
jgi:hypothetical protein